MAIPSISEGQSNRKPVSSELQKYFWPKFKRDMNCSLKRLNQLFLLKCILTHDVLHNYKVSRNSVVRIQWSILSCIFNFGQISKFKKGALLPQKIKSTFPVDMYICTLSPS